MILSNYNNFFIVICLNLIRMAIEFINIRDSTLSELFTFFLSNQGLHSRLLKLNPKIK